MGAFNTGNPLNDFFQDKQERMRRAQQQQEQFRRAFESFGGQQQKQPIKPSVPTPERVTKAFHLYCNTDNAGEKEAAKAAMERMGYMVKENIHYQLIRRKQ